MLMLVSLYGWTLAAGSLAAPALAVLGAHLATRDRALQTLCVSQGSLLGVLLGLGLAPRREAFPILAEWLPLGGALVVSALTFLATERLVATRMASRNTAFAFVFSLLLASGYLVSALFPALESHMTQIYFGDLATLPTSAARLCCVGFGAALLVLARSRRAFANGSFEWALFGEPVSRRGETAFRVLTLVLLCLSVQYLGFLFTTTALFLPTAMLRQLRARGVRRHLFRCGAVASVGTAAGFLVSLAFTRLPTVPTIAWALFLLAGSLVAAERAWPVRRKRTETPDGGCRVRVTPGLHR